MQTHQIQINVPDKQAVGAAPTANVVKLLFAIFQLFTAISSGNPTAIQAAIQAIIDALTGP